VSVREEGNATKCWHEAPEVHLGLPNRLLVACRFHKDPRLSVLSRRSEAGEVSERVLNAVEELRHHRTSRLVMDVSYHY
jgi:hypothetical protein